MTHCSKFCTQPHPYTFFPDVRFQQYCYDLIPATYRLWTTFLCVYFLFLVTKLPRAVCIPHSTQPVFWCWVTVPAVILFAFINYCLQVILMFLHSSGDNVKPFLSIYSLFYGPEIHNTFLVPTSWSTTAAMRWSRACAGPPSIVQRSWQNPAAPCCPWTWPSPWSLCWSMAPRKRTRLCGPQLRWHWWHYCSWRRATRAHR